MLRLFVFLPALVCAFTNTYNPMPEYQFSWTADAATQKLSVQVKLTPPSGKSVGWVGFGIAGGAGGMLGGDMFTAYSTSATACAIQDRRADNSNKALPAEDTASSDGFSDWTLDSCSLTGGVLTVAATRAFVTYDVHDLDFVSGPMTLLFVWGQDTPTSPTTITFHNGGYVPKAVSLWGAPIETFNKSALESDYDALLLSMPGVPIGPQTSYTCKGFNVTQKNGQATQAIAFEPQIQAINEPYVHHIVLYACTSPVSSTPFSCLSMPQQCVGILYAWGKGGNPFVLPPVTGVEIGTTGRIYVALQMHYNNPSDVTNLVDNSGVNIYRTNMIRGTYSGMFLFGTQQLNLPAGKSAFSVSGACGPPSTNGLPGAGVTAYASFMHAHQRGRRIWTSVYRNGTKLGTIGNNQNYDFNLQKMMTLSPTMTMLPGDTYVTYCSYDMSNDTSAITFGETTSNEMCFNFVAYYPILGSTPTYACGTSGNPASASNPGPNSCIIIPGDPPAAYVVTPGTTADTHFFTGVTATCAPGFTGTAVVGCTGYGAPYTFSGCMRSASTPTAAPGTPTPVNSGFVPAMSIATVLALLCLA